MSVRVMADVWDYSDSTGSGRLVLLAIADSADHDGTNAWPSVQTIANKCRLSPRTVQRLTKELVILGELRIVPGPKHIRYDRRPNGYEIHLVRGDKMTPRDATGCQIEPNGVTNDAPRGDMGVTQPILTHPDPSAVSGFLASAREHLQPLRKDNSL
jgi:hypothetical protein